MDSVVWKIVCYQNPTLTVWNASRDGQGRRTCFEPAPYFDINQWFFFFNSLCTYALPSNSIQGLLSVLVDFGGLFVFKDFVDANAVFTYLSYLSSDYSSLYGKRSDSHRL